MNLTTLSVTELKALAFDLVVQQQQAAVSLQAVQAEIAKRQQPPRHEQAEPAQE